MHLELSLSLFVLQCLFWSQTNGQSDGSLRLVSSSGLTGGSSGRLEVYYNSEWGTVCNDLFGPPDASVACRQLGYSRASDYGTVGTLGLGFSQASSSTPIWLDELRCRGTESRLDSCTHNGYGNQDCFHSEDIALVCSGSSTSGLGAINTIGIASGVSVSIVFLMIIIGFFLFIVICSKKRRQRATAIGYTSAQQAVMYPAGQPPSINPEFSSGAPPASQYQDYPPTPSAPSTGYPPPHPTTSGYPPPHSTTSGYPQPLPSDYPPPQPAPSDYPPPQPITGYPATDYPLAPPDAGYQVSLPSVGRPFSGAPNSAKMDAEADGEGDGDGVGGDGDGGGDGGG